MVIPEGADVFDDMSGMMKSPWAYVVLMGLLIVLTVLVLGAVRLRAAKEKRGGDPRHDHHLG